ncbi:hypothetical protein D3C80_997410 [compost metagenome]
MNTGGSGIAEQVEETLAGRLALNAHAHWPMVEEQAGVEVVGKVDQQLDAAFADLQELTLSALALVLTGAALTLATFDHHTALVDAQRLRNRRQGIKQTGLGLFRVYRAWGGVLLNVYPVLIQVDGQGVLRHVSVIQPVATDLLTLGPFA